MKNFANAINALMIMTALIVLLILLFFSIDMRPSKDSGNITGLKYVAAHLKFHDEITIDIELTNNSDHGASFQIKTVMDGIEITDGWGNLCFIEKEIDSQNKAILVSPGRNGKLQNPTEQYADYFLNLSPSYIGALDVSIGDDVIYIIYSDNTGQFNRVRTVYNADAYYEYYFHLPI